MTIYIRTLPTIIYERLKQRAKRNRRSVTQEAVVILEEALGKPDRPQEVWEIIDGLRERLRAQYGTFKDSAPLVREDRQR
jgi:plasmid stability protein